MCKIEGVPVITSKGTSSSMKAAIFNINCRKEIPGSLINLYFSVIFLLFKRSFKSISFSPALYWIIHESAAKSVSPENWRFQEHGCWLSLPWQGQEWVWSAKSLPSPLVTSDSNLNISLTRCLYLWSFQKYFLGIIWIFHLSFILNNQYELFEIFFQLPQKVDVYLCHFVHFLGYIKLNTLIKAEIFPSNRCILGFL